VRAANLGIRFATYRLQVAGKCRSVLFVRSHTRPFLQPQFVQWKVKIYPAKTNSFIESLGTPSLNLVFPRALCFWSLKIKHLKVKFGLSRAAKFTFQLMKIFQLQEGRFLCRAGRGRVPERGDYF